MKISNNSFLLCNSVKMNKLPHFGQSEVGSKSDMSVSSKIPITTPDYNVSTPIGYSFVEDIKLPNDLTAHCYKLANGQKVVIVPKDGATVVKTYVNTGSLNEPDNVRGISHYIEHNLFNGSDALGDRVFFDEVNKMGARTNASTSYSVTDYFIESMMLDDKDLENKIELHAGMLQSPKFLEDKLAKEKKIVDSEINMYLSDDLTKAQTLMLKNLFNIKSSSLDLVAGSTDNIDALTRGDVVKYFNDNYFPANMVTVITGEVEPDKTMQLVSKYFNSTKAPNPNRKHEEMHPTDKPVRADIISSKRQGAADIIIGFVGPKNAEEKDKVYLRAVNYMLSGLANAKFKDIEQKYSTGIGIANERLGTRPTDYTAQIIETSVPETYVEPMLKEIYGVLENASKNLPSEDEFQAIKNHIKKINSISLQSSETLNYHLGMDFLNGIPHSTANYAQIIDSMTYEDFVNTVKKYYNLENVSLAVVHPMGSTPESIDENYRKTKAPVSFTGLSKKEPLDLKNVEEYKLHNNFDVIFQNEDSDIVNYSASITMKDFTPHQAAVADVLSDMLKNSGTMTKSKKEVEHLFDINGVGCGVGVSDSGVALFGDFPVDKASIATDLFREKIQAPNLNEDLFKQAIQHCLDDYLTVESNAYEKYNKALYKNTPKSATTQEKLHSLSNVTLEEVKQLYNEIFKNGMGQIVVTGPFEKYPEFKKVIFENTSAYNKVQPKDTSLSGLYTPIEKSEVHTVETQRNQAEVFEGFKFKQNGNIKDNICLSILNNILGDGSSSRLFMDLREQRHLAYAVSSSVDSYDDIGVFNLRIKTTTNNTETGEKTLDNIKKSIDGFNENIERIKTDKVSQEELETSKKALKTDILASLEMNAGKNSALTYSSSTPYGVNHINEMFETINNITAEDVLNTAKNVFKSKPIYSISATKEAIDANREYLNGLLEK